MRKWAIATTGVTLGAVVCTFAANVIAFVTIASCFGLKSKAEPSNLVDIAVYAIQLVSATVGFLGGSIAGYRVSKHFQD
jgi:hypothetical protein